ncbi:prepilin peptidase [Streptomyces sp. ID05-04B]|uniref:prepilin peptidase n=1 Tax=unclassified Streptomyces TaxID=2593676 RepID=UPI000D19BFED|nr:MULTISPECIES: prepilin peptidase [unclassified Streptomyces]AVV41112.1 prepilin peptidase [Streptomyces sp. P3]MDX5568690.1 prepilin peptidase [Streptomyces sp. ID05-04B]
MTTPPSDLTLAAVAALWGAVTGALLPRAAYRFSVPPEEERDEQTEERDEQAERAGPDGPEASDAPDAPDVRRGLDGQAEGVGGWRAACPAGHPMRGWLGRARCRRCADTVAPGALLLPVLTALVCAALAVATGVRPESAVWLVLAPVGVLLAVVDVRVRRLPDPLTLPLAVAALALLGLAALLPEHAGHWTTALLGALALGAGYLVLHLVNPGGMAFGDVKLALGMGAVLGWYGWPTVMLGTFAAFLFGALYGGVLSVVGRAGRGTLIAFGPFMLVGTFAGLLVGAYAA